VAAATLTLAATAAAAAPPDPPPAVAAPPAGAPAAAGAPPPGTPAGAAASAQADAGEPRVDTSPAAGNAAAGGSPARAGSPAVRTSPRTAAAGGAAAPTGPKASAAADRVDLGTATVTGDREQPKVMYVVPWKSSDIGDLSGKPMNSLLDEALAPVDRDEFKREVAYYDAVKADRSHDGAPQPAANQGEK
jgi:hypothetical protein